MALPRGVLRAVALSALLALASTQKLEVLSMHGSGTTNPSKYFWQVMGLLEEEAKYPLHLTYRAVGSSTGQKEFVGDASTAYEPYNHFGSGDIPMTADRFQALQENSKEMLHVPFVLGAISFFHSVPGVPQGKRGLNLTACLLAKIFQRNITTWDHSEILAVNPELLTLSPNAAGQNIEVVHRVLGSSSTAGATEYMQTACPDVWVLRAGSTSNWPADTNAAQGSGNVAKFIRDNEYAIGYLDSGHGNSEGFSEIELKNRHGVYLSSTEANIGNAAAVALANGVLPSSADADWSSVNLYNQQGPDTWPITMFSYFYVRKDLRSLGMAGNMVKAFIEFVLSDVGQDMVLPFGFSKVPPEVVTYNNNTLTSLLQVGTDEFKFETAATTQVYDGADLMTISKKRRDYADIARSSMEEDIAANAARIADLEGSHTHSNSHWGAGDDDDHVDHDDHDDHEQLATGALVIALCAFILSVVNIVLTCRMRGGGSPAKNTELSSQV